MPRIPRRDLTALLLLLAAVGGGYHALTSAVGMPSGDHVDFYLRVQQYYTEISEGHWPQVLPDAVRGGSHAFPRFYPPLAHFVAAAVYPLAGDVVLASHLSMLLGVLLSGITMFVLLRAVGTGNLPAVLGSLVFCLFPFRATQLYVRGAFAEGWAMAWYPLVALGLLRATESARVPWWWPLTVAATLLSHTATSLWALPAVGGAVLLANPRGALAAWRPLAVGGALSVGLTAFSLLPVAWYLDSVRAGEPAIMLATSDAIGSFSSAWERRWSVAVLESVIVAGAVVLFRRSTGDLRGRLAATALVVQAALIAIGAAPAGVWEFVPQPWRYVQFGWRLITPSMFLAALAFGLLADRFATRPGRLVVTLAALAISFAGTMRLREEGLLDPGLTHATMLPWIGMPYGDYGLAGQGDYLPREADFDSLGQRIERTRDSLLSAGSLTLDGHGRPAAVRTSGASEVPLPLTAYDVFRVTDERGRELTTRSEQGQLVATADAEIGEVRISRRLPPVVAAGMAISLASLGLVMAAAARATGRRPATQPSLPPQPPQPPWPPWPPAPLTPP